jgi:nucleobase:cation symporter-1, NCS1 family
MTTQTTTTAAAHVEAHHIDIIPPGQRTDRAWKQGPFWFGGNVNIFNVVLGGVVVVIGLSFWQALAAIIAGTSLGALLIALHATQGPRTGVPQMPQSAAQFGFYGTSFLYAAVLLLNVGFIAACEVITAQCLNAAWRALPVPAWIGILAVPSLVIGTIGYRAIHRMAQLTAVVAGGAIIAVIAVALAYKALPSAELVTHVPPAGLFIAGVALFVIDMLSFGPFVSDYTRYVRPDAGTSRVFAWIWTGNVVSTVASGAAGAYLAGLLPKDGSVAAVAKVCGTWALILMAFSLLAAPAFNAYTGSFQLLALRNLARGRVPEPGRALRLVPFCVVLAGGTVVALLGYKGFVTKLSDFLDVLLVIFIPWSAVNLTDWFAVRRGRYDVQSFFRPDGIYGRWAWRGLTAYAVGLAAEWAFVSQPPYYVGPMVARLGGADISWIVGFFAAAALYYALCRAVPYPAAASTGPVAGSSAGRPEQAAVLPESAG